MQCLRYGTEILNRDAVYDITRVVAVPKSEDYIFLKNALRKWEDLPTLRISSLQVSKTQSQEASKKSHILQESDSFLFTSSG